MAVVLIIIGTFTGLAEGVIIKQYNSRHSRGGPIFTAVVSLFSMLFFMITDQNGFVFVPEMWWYGILSGVLYCVASFLTYVALCCGSFAMTMLILSYTMLFPIIYGIVFLQEQATAFTCVGLLALIVSVYLTQGKDDAEAEFSDSSQISDYARAAVSALAQCGILAGNGQREFCPKLNATQEEAAKVIYFVMEKFETGSK